jgi:hypothetical protein
MSYPRVMLFAIVASLIWSSAPATAQPLGSFRWQLLPFCNVITLNVTQQNGVYTLDGTEDRCGAAQAASAAGMAFLNPNGTVGFGITTVLPGGAPVHLEAAISIASLSGTWRDSAGNNGTLQFITGPGIGGDPRPVAPLSIPAASITAVHLSIGAVGPAALANGAVGSSALAANSVTGAHIVDGTITSADLATGAVGALAVAADAINGSHIVDASITGADLSNGAVGAAALAANSVTGAHIVDGSVTGVDLANGTVGSAALGANSVNGGHVVDGSLTSADIGDAPRLLPSVELPGTVVDLAHLVDEIILEITVVAPAAGRVLVNASGSFAFDNLTTIDQGFCSLTTGTIVAPPYAAVAFEGSAAGFRRATFGGTRVFSVAAGSSTFRLVCVAQGSNLGIADPVLTALFVAGS